MAKQRLDVAVFERGLAPSREKAQALIDEHTEKALHALDAFDADSTFLHEFAEKLATRSK